MSKQIRLEVANEFILSGCSVKTVLKSCFIARSSYYYKATLGKSGRKPYTVFLNAEGYKIESHEVVEALKELFEKPFVDYGYYKSYIYLRDELGFKVSKHSVYKLMKESGLLQNRYAVSSKRGKRNWFFRFVRCKNSKKFITWNAPQRRPLKMRVSQRHRPSEPAGLPYRRRLRKTQGPI